MKKQWFPITIKTSDRKTFGRWFVQNYEGSIPLPLRQVFAIGKFRLVLGK